MFKSRLATPAALQSTSAVSVGQFRASSAAWRSWSSWPCPSRTLRVQVPQAASRDAFLQLGPSTSCFFWRPLWKVLTCVGFGFLVCLQQQNHIHFLKLETGTHKTLRGTERDYYKAPNVDPQCGSTMFKIISVCIWASGPVAARLCESSCPCDSSRELYVVSPKDKPLKLWAMTS